MEIKIKVNQCKRNINLVLKEQLVINTESQVKDVEYVENGEYEVIPDDNYLLNKVNIKVNVPMLPDIEAIVETDSIFIKKAKVEVIDDTTIRLEV